MKEIDNDTLRVLNEDIEIAIKNRTAFLDRKMEEYAKVAIGEDMYNLKTGKLLGVVSEHYRYHEGDSRFDTSMNIKYRFTNGSNTSSQRLHSSAIGSKSDLIERKEQDLKALTD